MLLTLPTLIAETGLLSFIWRHHLGEDAAGHGLKEVPLKEVTMLRRLVVTHRANSYLSPAATRLIELFSNARPARLAGTIADGANPPPTRGRTT